jgi:nucleotidyltransferase substrate binding protein (TIGR01987 family)
MNNDKSKSKLLKSVERFENSLNDLGRSISWLETKSDIFDRWIGKDAVAKRYETSFEYFWKMLKIASVFQGTEAPGPRPAMQSAMQYGWIENLENFNEYLEARNQAVHDYFEISDEEYFQITIRFFADSKDSLEKIKKDFGI